MKRILLFLLVASIVLSLTACAKTTKEKVTSSTEPGQLSSAEAAKSIHEIDFSILAPGLSPPTSSREAFSK